ncbi:trypsin-like peptidase domain-containing protein [Nitrosospira multiformis]|nr:trypsin-like peptidase domain-containing protein [Nitrosospira multiformis]
MNPNLVDDFRPCLVAFVAFDHGNKPGLAGTGFIIGTGENIALVITAKHVLTEGVLNIQRPVPRYAPSAIFVPASSLAPAIEKEKLRAMWLDGTRGEAMTIPHCSYNDVLDIACCILLPQEITETPFMFRGVIPLDTARPSVGDIVHTVSLDAMDVIDHAHSAPFSGPRPFTASQRISIRRGLVTGVYPDGFRQYRWPCFTTSIPVEPGMSGGFVYFPREAYTISACGIVCADNSPSEARSNQMISGESVIAYSWPALALSLPERLPLPAPSYSLHEMMRKGAMPMAIGGIDHIEISNREPNGDCTIEYKMLQRP